MTATLPTVTKTLHIGNLNYSSWSLRPWLALRWAGITFEEHHIDLQKPGYGSGEIQEVLAVSPTGLVPALHLHSNESELQIHDSLAISEWVAEQPGGSALWPEDPHRRAQARAVTCEMHSGFAALRRDLPMNIHRRLETEPDWPDETQKDINRIVAMWSALREQNAEHGPWLFGARSIADAFYLPVVTRLRTYAVPLSGPAAAYSATALADDAFLEWEQNAEFARSGQPRLEFLDRLYR